MLAVRARGRWGGRTDKAWLVERARRPLPTDAALRRGPSELRWQLIETREARIAVIRLLDESDWTWVLDLCLHDPGDHGPDTRLFMRIPDASIETFIMAELARGDPHRIKALLRVVFALRLLACRTEVLESCARNSDPDIARQARRYLAIFPRRG